MRGTKRETRIVRQVAVILLGAALSLTLFTGCLTMPEDVQPESEPRVTLGLRVGAVDAPQGAAAGNASAIELDRIIVTMTSNAGQTLADTITAFGSRLSKGQVFLDPDAGTGQFLHPLYALPQAGDWTFTVQTLDNRDSVIHAETVPAIALENGAFQDIPVRLLPRFARYEARFALPAQVTPAPTAAVPNPAPHQVFFERLVLEVDGVPVRDSVARFFEPAAEGEDVVLAHEYLHTGTRQVAFKAYGYMEGDTAGVTAPRLLYQGGTAVEVALGKVAAQETVALDWTGGAADEDTGAEWSNAGMEVTFGKVHTTVINVTVPGAIDI